MDTWGAPLYGDPCRECGFTWAAGQAASIPLMRSLPDSIDELVIGASGTERLPDLGWNVSGYIAHMTDNTRIWAARLIACGTGRGLSRRPLRTRPSSRVRALQRGGSPGSDLVVSL